jgi:hypothetical protein
MPMKRKFIFLLLCTLFSVASLAPAAAPAKDSGWTPLFNGKDFSGFYLIGNGRKKNEDPNHLFQIHDGMVHMYKDAEAGTKQPFGYFITEKEYSHYHLRFQYKWGTKKFIPKMNAQRDAGVLFHCIGNDGVWPKSVECQVQEGDVGDIFTVFTRVTTTADPATTNTVSMVSTNTNTGVVKTNQVSQPYFKDSAEGGVPLVQGVSTNIRRVHRGSNCEVPGWNTVEMIVRGDSATYLVNGKMNNRILHLEHMVDGKWVPLSKGKILFQQEGAEVFYRNIEIKILDP